jgi:hypothetical protein
MARHRALPPVRGDARARSGHGRADPDDGARPIFSGRAPMTCARCFRCDAPSGSWVTKRAPRPGARRVRPLSSDGFARAREPRSGLIQRDRFGSRSLEKTVSHDGSLASRYSPSYVANRPRDWASRSGQPRPSATRHSASLRGSSCALQTDECSPSSRSRVVTASRPSDLLKPMGGPRSRASHVDLCPGCASETRARAPRTRRSCFRRRCSRLPRPRG